MIKNIKNIAVAKDILILHHNNIIKKCGQAPEIELKKLKKTTKRQNKKDLKKYIEIE